MKLQICLHAPINSEWHSHGALSVCALIGRYLQLSSEWQIKTWHDSALGVWHERMLQVTIVTLLSDNLWQFYTTVHWGMNMRNVSNNRYIHNNIIGQNRKSIRYFVINNCFLLLLVEWRIKMGKISLSYFLLFITLQPSSVTHWET